MIKARSSILDGLKVIEFASVLAGPAVGMFFAELGAEVIKIENLKSGGDITRTWKHKAENKNNEKSAYYHSVNWNKQVLFLDLTKSEDQSKARTLIETADIMLTNFKCGDATKFNLDYSELRITFHKLIIAEIKGYDDSDRLAYDAVLQAESGLMSINGDDSTGPQKLPIAFIDIMAAHQLKEAILISLLQRASTGKGSHLVVSLYRSAIASLANQGSNWLNLQVIPKATGSLHPNIAPYGETLTTSEGHKILLAVGSDDQFNRLCRVLSMEELILDFRFNSNVQRVMNRYELINLLNDASVKFGLNDLLDKLFAADIPCSKIRTIDEVLSDPIAKEMILEQNELDGGISYRLSTIAFDIDN